MRKLVSYLVCSLDGVVSDPQDWVFDRFDDEMLGQLEGLIARQDAVLLGRTTYQEWHPYRESSTHEPFASFINDTPKYLVSTTLEKVEWRGSTLVTGNVADEVTRLKGEPGGDISVHGSVHLVRSLLHEDLLDELKLAVFPVVAARGVHLFDDFDQVQRLHLAGVEQTGTGVLFLTYEPHPA